MGPPVSEPESIPEQRRDHRCISASIQFINSCKEVSLSSGSRFVPNTTSGDFVYCLISGRSKIMRIDSEENNWELKRLKLVTLHNCKS